MFKLDLEKAEEPEIKLLTSVESLKKQESIRKTSVSVLLTVPKPLPVWITHSCTTSEMVVREHGMGPLKFPPSSFAPASSLPYLPALKLWVST